MTIRKVLIIGAPLAYDLVDIKLIERYQLKPFFLFKDEDAKIVQHNKQNIYVDELTTENLKKIVIKYNLDGIVCFNDKFLIDVSVIRRDLGIQGISFSEMKKFKCKSAMYDAIKKELKTIPYLPLHNKLSYESVCGLLGEAPFFIKPDSSAGSEGAVMINNKKEYMAFINQLQVNNGDHIIQPYIDGTLYHCEVIVHNGNVIYSQAGKYSYPNFNILSGKIIASFPIRNTLLSKEIEEAAESVQKILNFKNGIMHTEFFKENGEELKFLETNIRPPGGDINLIHMNRLGVSMETVMILLEMGKDIQLAVNSEKLYTSGYIPMKKGKVIGFNYPDLKGKVEFKPKVNIGDICYTPKSASDAALSYVGEYDSIEDMEDDFRLIESIDIIQYSL